MWVFFFNVTGRMYSSNVRSQQGVSGNLIIPSPHSRPWEIHPNSVQEENCFLHFLPEQITARDYIFGGVVKEAIFLI